MILCFDDYEAQARRLAQALGMPCHAIQRHRFPDDENKLTLPTQLPRHVIFCRSLDHPNEKLLELLLAAKTARSLGAETLSLVAPYLCYMRQDMAFNPGEAVSQTIIGHYLAELFDNLITVDPHLHRIDHLGQAVPATKAVSLTATNMMADFLQDHVVDPVLVGPDSESAQWVSAVAKSNSWEYVVCEKGRRGDKEVRIIMPNIDMHKRTVVIVDDVASSGQTLKTAITECFSKNASHVNLLVTHALFGQQTKQALLEAGAQHIWSTDSVSHDSNAIQLCDLLKQAVLELGIK
ncbi:MAG: ribose-phosphate diphosphokinase [Gammaproteobacteria bacterium]|nr:ribose-phosphate diphosphokinase [Gammaproteobacteria bacterium]